jgi:hypothetical protein
VELFFTPALCLRDVERNNFIYSLLGVNVPDKLFLECEWVVFKKYILYESVLFDICCLSFI